MSKRHPIDELFSQRLGNSSASVPDDMWSRINKTRQKQVRKPILKWSALGILAVGFCALGWWMTDTPLSLGHFPLTEEAVVATPITASADNAVNSPVNQIATPVSTEALASTNAQHSTTIATTSVQTTTLSSQPSGHNSTGTVGSTPDINTFILNNTNENTASSTSTTTSANTDNTYTEELAASAENQTEISLENNTNRVAGPHQRGKAEQLLTRPLGGVQLFKPTDIKLFANHAPRCADFANPFFHLDAELLAGPAYANQMLAAKTTDSGSHLQQRQASENALLSASTGFRLAATSNTGLGLRSGLSYTQINEQFTEQVGSKIDVSIRFDPNGQVIGRDTTYTDAYEKRSTNRLKFIELPLLLGYEQKVGKFRVGLNAGAYLNLFFDAKGTVFSPATGEPIAFGQEGDSNRLPIFERSATAAWYGGLSVAYNLRGRYSLLAEPYFKSYPRALSSTGYDLAQNYWMGGLQVGLRMRL